MNKIQTADIFFKIERKYPQNKKYCEYTVFLLKLEKSNKISVNQFAAREKLRETAFFRSAVTRMLFAIGQAVIRIRGVRLITVIAWPGLSFDC